MTWRPTAPGLVRTSRQVALLGQGNNPTSLSGQGSPLNLLGLDSNQDSPGSLHGQVVNQDNQPGLGSLPNSPSGLALSQGNPHGLANLANPQPQDGPVQPQVQAKPHQQQLRGL